MERSMEVEKREVITLNRASVIGRENTYRAGGPEREVATKTRPRGGELLGALKGPASTGSKDSLDGAPWTYSKRRGRETADDGGHPQHRRLGRESLTVGALACMGPSSQTCSAVL